MILIFLFRFQRKELIMLSSRLTNNPLMGHFWKFNWQHQKHWISNFYIPSKCGSSICRWQGSMVQPKEDIINFLLLHLTLDFTLLWKLCLSILENQIREELQGKFGDKKITLIIPWKTFQHLLMEKCLYWKSTWRNYFVMIRCYLQE